MSKNLTVNGEAMNASLEGMLAVELFLNDKYLFRRNVLNGKVEFSKKPTEANEPVWRPLTEQALNSIVLEAMRADICEGKNPKSDIQTIINSDDVPTFDPIKTYLDSLSCLAVFLASVLSNSRTLVYGCALVLLIGCRWIRFTATNAYPH